MPSWIVRTALALGVAVSAATCAAAASLDGLAVTVVNKSEPVLCAEKDNVSLEFSNPAVRSFRIEAAHPVYLGTSSRMGSYEADWTACDLSADPSFKPPVPPRKVTLYEDIETWAIGWTFSSFWRPSTAVVRIGDRVERNIHLIQVWGLRPNGGEELLVLYPQDGYWRIRPMTPPDMAATAYGSSFLIGPIEQDVRPIVRIKEVAFDPPTRTFTLSFEKGGTATVRMYPDVNRHAVDVTFDKPIANGPFAMMRSMYITEFNNDVSRFAVREKDAKGWREGNIMAFDKAVATDIWAGRLSPSQHNTSSPDFMFNSFSDTDRPKRPKAEPPPGVTVKPK